MRSLNLKIIIAIIILAAAGWYFFIKNDEAGAQQGMAPQAIRVRTAPVETSTQPIIINAVGTVIAENSVAIKSRLDSQIESVNFKEGDFVKQGDLLFKLDDRTIKAQLKQEQANLAKERAQAENLKTQYERNKELSSKGFESESILDDSRAAYEAQNAALGSIEAAIENIKVTLEYTSIKAPISGRTGTINIKEGNNVKANDTTALVTINQITPIAVQFSIPQQFLGRIKGSNQENLTVTASSQSMKEEVSGTIKYVNNEIDQSTGSFLVKALFNNENEKLWPGMFVNLKLSLGNESGVIAIPEQAMQQGQNEYYVYVVEENKAIKRTVTFSRAMEGKAIITEGLKEGEVIVTDGFLNLTDGASISIAEQKNEPQETHDEVTKGEETKTESK